MSGEEENAEGRKDDDISVGTNFSIKFSNTSSQSVFINTISSPVENIKFKNDGKDSEQNFQDLSEGSKVIKNSTEDVAKSVNGERTSKQNSSITTGGTKGIKDGDIIRRESFPNINITSDQYDEAFVEKLSDLDGFSDDNEDVNSTSFQNKTDETSFLLPETDNEESTKHSTKALEQQSSVDSAVTETSTSTAAFSFRSLGNRHKLILISICLCNFLSYLCLSLIAPFFPEEAAAKNVSDAISGWIFGAFAFTQFLISPVFGRLIPLMGVKFMYICGLFLAAGCTVLFGCLTFIDTSSENITFIIYCFLLRIILAVGCCALQTASFTLTAKEFPDSVATVFGTTEVFVGIGFMSGPPIGGFLYASGGFVMPFAVVGAIMFLGVPFNFWLIPADTVIDKPSESKVSVWMLLKSTKTIVNCLAVIVAAMIYSILDPTLEPHLNSTFSLNTEIIGLLFLLMAAFYAISSPIVGSIADKLPDNRILLIPGFIGAAAGMLFLGPSKLTGLQDYKQLWLNIICLIVLGISASIALIPTFDIFIDIAEEMGFDDDMGMYGMVAGIWGSMYAFGDFIGPSLGGVLLDEYGFEFCCTITAGACLFMIPVLTISWLYDTRCCTQKSWKEEPTKVVITVDETTPLLTESLEKYEHDVMSSYPPNQ